MTGALEILNPLKCDDWDSWLASQQESTIFHSAEWARVLSESYGYKPLYFSTGVRNNPAVLLPVMEVSSILTGRRGVSLPFSDQCNALMADGAGAKEILDSVCSYGRRAGWRFIEFRDDTLFDEQAQPSVRFYYHHLDLPGDLKEYFRNVRHGTRSSVNKAIRQGVRITIRDSGESMESYYRLNCLTRKKHGLPPQPLEFFRKVLEHVIARKLGYIIEASYHGRPVAAAICFHFGNNAIMKYAAYDDAYQMVRPNNLLVWETIRWYAEAGYKTLSFGRTDLRSKGLRHFKNGWNTSERALHYYKFDLKLNRSVEDSHPFIEWSPRLLKKIPIPALRVLGRLLYKHMG